MPVKIRLQRRGRKKSPFYHIVVADARAPRDGRFIEKLGTYNPMTKPATIEINRDSAYDWLMKGAQPTDTARAILRFKGVMYRKHLMRGVSKGALTEEQAMVKYQAWIDEKEAKIAARRAETQEEIRKFHEMINGKAPAKKVAPVKSELIEGNAPAAESGSFVDSVETTTVESLSGDAPAAEPEVEAVKAAPKVEEAPAPVVEEVKEEAPAPVAEAAPVVEEVKEEAPAAKVEETDSHAVALGEVTDQAEAAKAEVTETATTEETAGDDLTVIEGIGPKIAELLNGTGIKTFADLAKATEESIKETLTENKLGSHNPGTWGKQAQMAADGNWADLKKWQDELDGGKEAK